jgi:hypothetical protein
VLASGRFRFALEARATVWIGADLGWEDFDGDRAIQAGIAGLVAFAQAAGTDADWISCGPRRGPAAKVVATSRDREGKVPGGLLPCSCVRRISRVCA